MRSFICKVLVALLLTCGVCASETGHVSAAPVCDVVVLVGDSLVSESPAVYLPALYNAGFPNSAAVAGAGRAISFPDIGNGVVVVSNNGTVATWWWNDKHSTLDDVVLVRWANTRNDKLCWVAAIGTNDAAHQPQSEWVSYINQLMAAIGTDPVVWVNMWANSPDYPLMYSPAISTAWNTTLSQTLQPYSNASIYDWASYASVHPEIFDAGGIHLTAAGYSYRASAIATAAQSRWLVASRVAKKNRRTKP